MMEIAHLHQRLSQFVLAFFVVFTVFMAISATQLKLQANMEKMVPQDLDVRKANEIIRDKFGGGDFLLVVIEADTCSGCVLDLRRPEVAAYIRELAQKISEEPDVGGVESMLTSPGLIDNSYSVTYLRVKTSTGSDEERIRDLIRRIREDIENTPKPSGLKVSLTGITMVRKQLFDLMLADGKRVVGIAYLLIILALVLTLYSFRDGILPLICVSCAVIWTGGAMARLGIPVSVMSIGIAPMLLGMGIDYSIHVVHRIRRNFVEGYASIFRPILVTSVTTMLGFGSLLFAKMPGLRDFGALGVIGIFFSMVAALFLLPSLYLNFPLSGSTQSRALIRFPSGIVRKKGLLILLLLILMGIFSQGFKGIRMESSTEKALPQSEIVQKMQQIRDLFGGDAVVVLVEAPEINNEVIGEMGILERAFQLVPHVVRTVSAASLGLPIDRNPLISEDKKYALILIDTDVGTDTKKIKALLSSLERVASEVSTLDVRFAGALAVSYATSKLMVRDFRAVTGIAMALIFAFLLFNFRSIRIILLLSLPLFIALYFTFATLGFLGIPMRPETMGLASTILGIGVDYAIIITYRYLERGDVVVALDESQGSILSSATTTIAGFSSLLFASMTGLKYMGLSMAIGIFYCLVVSLLFYPVILQMAGIEAKK